MDQITRCELHNTTFIAEEGSMFDRCFVCVFEENDRLHKRVEELEKELRQEEEDADHYCKLVLKQRTALEEYGDKLAWLWNGEGWQFRNLNKDDEPWDIATDALGEE